MKARKYTLYEDCRKEVKRIASEMTALEADRDKLQAQYDSLYLAVKEEVERLRAKSEANVSMVHWAQADRLQEILDKVPDYGEAKS